MSRIFDFLLVCALIAAPTRDLARADGNNAIGRITESSKAGETGNGGAAFVLKPALPNAAPTAPLLPSLTGCGIDEDKDGLDDALEQRLINYYRPYYLYDSRQHNPDDKWPASVTWYISRCTLLYYGNGIEPVFTRSQLADKPQLILQAGNAWRPSSSRDTLDVKTAYRLNLAEGSGTGEGPDAHTGTYARVNTVNSDMGPAILVQYMQFFPYNDFQDAPGNGDHQADWVFLEVYLRPSSPFGVLYFVYHHHGDSNCDSTKISGNYFMAAHGDSIPRCYIEEDEHEWWPFPGDNECSFGPYDNASHDGQGVKYRSENILNIGEYGRPMAAREAQIIALYNGRWGSTFHQPWFGVTIESPFGPPFQHAFGGGTCLTTTLSSPADEATCVRTNSPLTWRSAPVAAGYRVQIATSPTFGASIVDEQLICGGATSYSPVLTPLHLYYWRVIAQPEACRTDSFSATRSFTTGPDVPEVPSLVSPVDGAATQPTTGILDWSDSPGTVDYVVRIRCPSGDKAESIPPVTSSQCDYALPDGTYLWDVLARNECGSWTGRSPTRTFTVGAGSRCAIPVLLGPPDSSACVDPDSGVVLRWRQIPGATGYVVSWRQDMCGGDQGTVTQDTFLVVDSRSGLNPGHTYFWNVTEDCLCAEASNCFSFVTTRHDPGFDSPPDLASPSNGANGQPLSGLLSWRDKPHAVSYQVQIDSLCSAGSVVEVMGTSMPYSGLVQNTEYHWRVRARDACNRLSAFSPCDSFRTVKLTGIDRVYLPEGLSAVRGQAGFEIPVLIENLSPLKQCGIKITFDDQVLVVTGMSLGGTRTEDVPGVTVTGFSATNHDAQCTIVFTSSTSCSPTLPAGGGAVVKFIADIKPTAPTGASEVGTDNPGSFKQCSGSSPTTRFPGQIQILTTPTAISVALQDVEAEVGLVRLRWYVPDSRGVCTVQRRTAESDWGDVGLASFERPGVVAFEDRSVSSGERYAYRLFVQTANDQGFSNEVWVLVPTARGAPLALRLDPSYPNPFQTQTTLNFGIPAAATVKLGIYNVTGRRVATVIDRNLPAGWRSATWDGRDSSGRPVASGTYFARLESAGRVEIRKIVVAR